MTFLQTFELVGFAGATTIAVGFFIIAIRIRCRSRHLAQQVRDKENLIKELLNIVPISETPTLFTYHPETTNGQPTEI